MNFTTEDSARDGEIIRLPNVKELGHSDFYATGVRHAPNGHQFAIFNDREYAIFRSQNFKGCGFGQGCDFVWSHNSDYAVRESFSVKVFRSANNQLHFELKTDYSVEGLFGGPLL